MILVCAKGDQDTLTVGQENELRRLTKQLEREDC